MTRLAIIVSHPVQYYAPWFRLLAGTAGLDVQVFYLWDFGVSGQVDPGFGTAVTWDLPLLEGYPWEFVPNRSPTPGTTRFGGLDNPTLGRRVRAFRPDAVLVFGHGWRAMQEFLWFRRPGGVPVLFRGDSHCLVPRADSFRERLRRRFLSATFRRIDAFLTVGRANADYFRDLGVPDHKQFFAPHSVDNERFRRTGTPEAGATLRRELGIPPQHRVVLFAGKFEPKKRPGDLLAAFQQDTPPHTTLILAGAGVLEGELRAAAAGRKDVRFLPFQNQTAMPRLYAAADVFVLPSDGPQETWGLAVNEAMNCGCACIVSDHVGCAIDLVRDGESGRVFSAGNVAALADALTDTLANNDQLARWQAAGRRIVAAYSYEAAREGLLAALTAVGASAVGSSAGAASPVGYDDPVGGSVR